MIFPDPSSNLLHHSAEHHRSIEHYCQHSSLCLIHTHLEPQQTLPWIALISASSNLFGPWAVVCVHSFVLQLPVLRLGWSKSGNGRWSSWRPFSVRKVFHSLFLEPWKCKWLKLMIWERPSLQNCKTSDKVNIYIYDIICRYFLYLYIPHARRILSKALQAGTNHTLPVLPPLWCWLTLPRNSILCTNTGQHSACTMLVTANCTMP